MIAPPRPLITIPHSHNKHVNDEKPTFQRGGGRARSKLTSHKTTNGNTSRQQPLQHKQRKKDSSATKVSIKDV